MAARVKTADLQKPKTTPQMQLAALRGHIYTMAAAFAGVILGVLGSLGFVGSYLHAEFASENAALSKKIVSMAPTSEVTSACVAPSGSGKSGSSNKPAAVQTASAPMNGGNGGGNNGGGKGGGGGQLPSVTQLVNGSIKDTGPNSTNTITATNTNTTTVTNNNFVDVTNASAQNASSGNATVKNNTNGGAADSGNASNQHNSNTSISIEN